MKTLDNTFDTMIANAWSGIKIIAGILLFIGVLLQAMQTYIF